MAHSRPRDGSIPSAATSRVQPWKPYTHNKVGSTPTRSTHTGRTPSERHFPAKEGESPRGFHTRTRKISRGASGEAMTHRGGSAMSPFGRHERTLGSIPSTATRRRRPIARGARSRGREHAIVPRTGRSATNAVVRVRFLPVVPGNSRVARRAVRCGEIAGANPACQTHEASRASRSLLAVAQ